MQRRPTRRDVILGTGAAMTAGVAGCLGDDDDPDPGDSDPGDDTDPDDEPTGWEPEREVLAAIPFGEGGGTDTYMRNILPAVGDILGTTFRIENMTSAGGMEAIGQAIRADPDGHTITAYNPPSTPITYLILDPPFDMAELEGIAIYVRNSPTYLAWGLVEHEFQSLNDMIDRYNDGEFEALGVQDVGGPTSVLALMLQEEADWNWANMVNYTGTGPVAADLVAGNLDAALASDSGAYPTQQDNPEQFEPIAFMHSEGSLITGDLPIQTLEDETGVNLDFLASLNRLILAPPETPTEIQDIQSEAVHDALLSDGVQEWSEQGDWPLADGGDFEFGGPDEAKQLNVDVIEGMREQLDLDDLRAEFG